MLEKFATNFSITTSVIAIAILMALFVARAANSDEIIHFTPITQVERVTS